MEPHVSWFVRIISYGLLSLIIEVIEEFKGQPFAWWIGPSCDPRWLPNLLEEMGFKKATTVHAMVLDFKDYNDLTESQTIHAELLCKMHTRNVV